MVGPGRPQIVLFGSSIIEYCFHEGYGAILADKYARKADIVLRGYAGWNTRRAIEVLDKVFPKDSLVQPSLVILYFGGNDAMLPRPDGTGPHVPIEEYKNNMKIIADHIRGLSRTTKLLVLTTPPCNEAFLRLLLGDSFYEKGKRNEDLHRYSEACIEICKETGIEFIDLWHAIQEDPTWLATAFVDGIHFTPHASLIIIRKLEDTLRVWQPNLYWGNILPEFDEPSPYDP